MDIKAGRTILRLKEVLSSGLLLLEDNDGSECLEHSKSCIPCHLPIEGTSFSDLAVVLEGFPCFVCGKKKIAATMLVCDQCQHGWHMACLRPPLTTIWTVELSLLSRIFGIWCFHQSYSMILCGFYCVMHVQLENDEL